MIIDYDCFFRLAFPHYDCYFVSFLFHLSFVGFLVVVDDVVVVDN